MQLFGILIKINHQKQCISVLCTYLVVDLQFLAIYAANNSVFLVFDTPVVIVRVIGATIVVTSYILVTRIIKITPLPQEKLYLG